MAIYFAPVFASVHALMNASIRRSRATPTINFPNIPPLAAGGPISGLALVGEKGPELFAGVGTIIPNHALGGTTVNVTVNARVDAGIDMGTAGVAITRMINDGVSAGLDSVARKVTAGV